tara:strand:+ start:3823 stop:4950 length:1128 start_codon:yes stop_codon:yes gene_type:complete
MTSRRVYLDYNATAPVYPEVIEEVAKVLAEGGNASSVHAAGRAAKARLEKSRQIIADMLNCRPQMITFTSGGTEANNFALKASGAKRLIISAAEHDSILEVARTFAGEVEILPLDHKGYVRRDILQQLLDKSEAPTVVSIMLANNETGVLQDIAALAEMVHDHGALFHTDAIQALGKVPVDFRTLGVDMMSLSAHKVGGPQGVGALIAWEKLDILPLIQGGGQEVGRRSGTENIAGIAGFAKAVSLVPRSLQKAAEIREWRDEMEQILLSHAPDAKIFGAESERLPTVSSILMPGVNSETQVMAFDLDGLCVSAGSACSSGKVKSSHVITAMGGTPEEAASTLRLSLGWATTREDIGRFVKSWCRLYDRKIKKAS